VIWRENELTPQTPRYYPKAQIRQGVDHVSAPTPDVYYLNLFLGHRSAKPRKIGVEKGGHVHDENSFHLPRRYMDT
jgi:hypothetical protein